MTRPGCHRHSNSNAALPFISTIASITTNTTTIVTTILTATIRIANDTYTLTISAVLSACIMNPESCCGKNKK
jgi:hypothetical protein